MQNWRQAIRTPTAYRVGNSAIRMQTSFVYSVAICGSALLMLLYLLLPHSRHGVHLTNEIDGHALHSRTYNATYPLSPVRKVGPQLMYRVAAITDLDEKNKADHNLWVSYIKYGMLTFDPRTKGVNLVWESNLTTLQSSYSFGGRGMELSELVVFDGRLLTVDDRTGIVFEIIDGKRIVPWVLLADGDGKQTKGFKSEWMAVLNNELYVGGLGKEWTNAHGVVVNNNPQWIKIISPAGGIHHMDWHRRYDAIRNAAGIQSPGYMIHEAAAWSEVHKRWFFLPRRASKERYDEVSDERRGTNLVIKCSENFKEIDVMEVGSLEPTRGFSSFKFVPGSNDEVIVALKSEEVSGKISTYATVFHIDGFTILPETKIGDFKFEGIEFV